MINKRYVSLLIITCLTVGVAFRLIYWNMHPLIIWADQSVYMAMAQLFLAGKIPYIDFFDFNLPLIIYINAVPMAFAKIFAQPPPLMLDIFILFLLALSIYLSNIVFSASKSRLDRQTRLPWLVALVVFTQMQLADFGQREHFFVLLSAPYLLVRCLYPNCKNIRYSSLMGVMAGIGANIKPHFFVLMVVFEIAAALAASGESGNSIVNALKTRFNRPETRAFALTTVIYLLHFFLYPFKAWQVFFNEALPIYINGSGWFGHSLISSLSGEEDHKYYFFALVAVTLLALPRTTYSRLTVPLLAFSWGGVIVYLTTGGTWTYRLLPTEAGTMFLTAAELGLFLSLLRGKYLKVWPRLRQVGLIALAAGTAVIVVSQFRIFLRECAVAPSAPIGSGYQYSCPLQDFTSLYYNILNNSVPDDSIVYIGGGVRPGYPAILQARRRPGSRYLHGMIIPMLRQCINDREDPKYSQLLHQVATNYGEDILKNHPAVVYYEFDMFGGVEDEFFRSHYLNEYTLVGTLESVNCNIYKLRSVIALQNRPEDTKREIIMKVLLQQMTVDQACARLKMKPTELDKFLRNASAAIDRSLFGAVGGGDEELYVRLQKAEEEKRGMIKTIDKLLREQMVLKEKMQAQAAEKTREKAAVNAVSGGDK